MEFLAGDSELNRCWLSGQLFLFKLSHKRVQFLSLLPFGLVCAVLEYWLLWFTFTGENLLVFWLKLVFQGFLRVLLTSNLILLIFLLTLFIRSLWDLGARLNSIRLVLLNIQVTISFMRSKLQRCFGGVLAHSLQEYGGYLLEQ